jgi:hypothetical protein
MENVQFIRLAGNLTRVDQIIRVGNVYTDRWGDSQERAALEVELATETRVMIYSPKYSVPQYHTNLPDNEHVFEAARAPHLANLNRIKADLEALLTLNSPVVAEFGYQLETV